MGWIGGIKVKLEMETSEFYRLNRWDLGIEDWILVNLTG